MVSWQEIGRKICNGYLNPGLRTKEVDVCLGNEEESLDHRGNQEIAAEFDEVRARGLVGDDEGVLTKGLEQGLARLHGFRLTGGHDKKLARRGGLRAAKHRCRHEALPRSLMRAREPLGERDADLLMEI